MDAFRDYDIKYPELVYDIVDYFRVSNPIKKVSEKSVLDYCTNSKFNHQGGESLPIQPDVVHMICEKLVEKRVLSCLKTGQNWLGSDANYIYICNNEPVFLSKDPALIFRYNCMVYGFPYIYSNYKKHVLPIIVREKSGKTSVGTCFRFRTGIVTAKHCIDAKAVAIPAYNSEQLKQCEVFISKDEEIDLAYIELNSPSFFLSEKACVLDEVLVMGYPKIPMFFDFCAAERASISSIVPTKGAVASLADQFISPKAGPLMLVTARIRGGNSGGPIINSNGAVVGVAFSEPMSEGDYDEMGYGVAYPIGELNRLLKDRTQIKVNFVEEQELYKEDKDVINTK